MNAEHNLPMGAQGPTATRRPYIRPQLKRYGDIRELTRGGSPSPSSTDNQGKGKAKTS